MKFVLWKKKTAYDMRISDWSSDVCSSDLQPPQQVVQPLQLVRPEGGKQLGFPGERLRHDPVMDAAAGFGQRQDRAPPVLGVESPVDQTPPAGPADGAADPDLVHGRAGAALVGGKRSDDRKRWGGGKGGAGR